MEEDSEDDLNWTKKIPTIKEEAYMIGRGLNRANISGIKLDLSNVEIEGLGEGLGVAVNGEEERKEPNYIEALQFTETKPKKSKTRQISDEKET